MRPLERKELEPLKGSCPWAVLFFGVGEFVMVLGIVKPMLVQCSQTLSTYPVQQPGRGHTHAFLSG